MDDKNLTNEFLDDCSSTLDMIREQYEKNLEMLLVQEPIVVGMYEKWVKRQNENPNDKMANYRAGVFLGEKHKVEREIQLLKEKIQYAKESVEANNTLKKKVNDPLSSLIENVFSMPMPGKDPGTDGGLN